MINFDKNQWALILGGSSGFGLAAAKVLTRHGMSVCVVHRNRRNAMPEIQKEFDSIKAADSDFFALNLDALSADGRKSTLDSLSERMGDAGTVKLLLHSIALGSLKPLASVIPNNQTSDAVAAIAARIGVKPENLKSVIDDLFAEGVDVLHPLIKAEYPETSLTDDDLASTVFSMGSSLLTWVRELHDQKMFGADARVIGLTSEGNEIAWRGYAAVSAAKAVLEAVSRAIAFEMAPYGIRSNLIQPGVTATPALAIIPGSRQMKAAARLRNPFKRLTRTEDVANFICLMCTDYASWVNGTIIRVDGGEHIGTS